MGSDIIKMEIRYVGVLLYNRGPGRIEVNTSGDTTGIDGIEFGVRNRGT